MRGTQRPEGERRGRVSAEEADKTQSDYPPPFPLPCCRENAHKLADCPPRIGVHRYVYDGETQKQGFIPFGPARPRQKIPACL